ncbi:MAG: histidine phosphatase family protein [Chloroflexota bacterium]
MKRLYVVRHGARIDHEDRSWKNTAERPFDPPLSENGQTQAQKTGVALKGHQIGAVYASPLLRTIQTASYFASSLSLPIQIEAGVVEWLNPKWYDFSAGMLNLAEMKDKYHALNLSYESLVTPRYPEQEEETCIARCAFAARQLSSEHPDGSHALIVTHGVCVNAIVQSLVGNKDGVNAQTCAITILEETFSGWTLVSSSTDHLNQSLQEEKVTFM